MIVQSASSRCQWIQALFSNRVVVSYICHGDCILLVHGCIIYAMEEEARGRGKIDAALIALGLTFHHLMPRIDQYVQIPCV